VAALIKNIGDQGSDFTTLQNAGVDARQYTPTFDLHHKYGIIDANTPNSDPTVVTGSHNWSYSAEQVNDENTLIIHNANIANWFLQEFSKRYCEVSAQNPCSYNPAVSTVDLEFSEIQIFPNPFQNQFQIQGLKEGQRIFLFNSLGQFIYSEIAQNSTSLINLSSFSNGFYNLVIEDKHGNKKAYKVFKID
jgi:phosphatidylserine/phosphatidylglycerophosphate/cardiolipin synthase-like enzyme